MSERTMIIYPIAWLETAKLFAECGALALPLKDFKEDVQSVFIEMEKAKIITINKYGSLHLRKRLPKDFRYQMNKYT